ncbi:MAG TPA: hypothetical protein VGD77_12195 [Gemmatimonadaceae bacterium]
MTDLPQVMTAAQRAFVDSAEALGAVRPDDARSLAELPRISNRELGALVEAGLVREAAAGRYYVFRTRRPVMVEESQAGGWRASARAWRTGRFVRTLLFWILLILVPILLLQLMEGR